MIYLLAVVDEVDRAVAALSAVTDHDVTVVPHGPLACIGLGWPGPRPDPEPAALRRHNQLVEALMRACTVVPFRFATLVAGASEVDAWLAERGGDLQSLLGRLRGRVEMALRASTEGPPHQPDEPRSGRDYLAALRRERTAGPALVDIHRRLSALSAGSLVAGDSRGLSASYLVDTARVPAFRRRAERLASEQRGITGLSVTGPWAPYSFVGGSATADNPLAAPLLEPQPASGGGPRA